MTNNTKALGVEEVITLYFQGIMTKNDIMLSRLPFKIELSDDADFMHDFFKAFRSYSHDDYLLWTLHSSDQKVTDMAPTVEGLIHNINQFLEGILSEQDFIDWASILNSPYASNLYSRFENQNIDYLCTFFLPSNYKKLEKKHIRKL